MERVFSYCTEKEYYDFMRGVIGFERDLEIMEVERVRSGKIAG